MSKNLNDIHIDELMEESKGERALKNGIKKIRELGMVGINNVKDPYQSYPENWTQENIDVVIKELAMGVLPPDRGNDAVRSLCVLCTIYEDDKLVKKFSKSFDLAFSGIPD